MKRWLVLLLPACSAAALASPAIAPAGAGGGPSEDVRRFVAEEIVRTEPGLRAEIAVGEIDPQLRLAPCAHTEAFLRPGARLWGHSFVGLHCIEGSAWSTSVPVNVRLYGPALVMTQAVPALQAIPRDSVRSDEVEVTREPGGVVVSAAQVEEHFCTRRLESGQSIPMNCLRTIPAVGQGDAVRLVGVGNGFSISTDGTALATVGAGEQVRVRTDSGRTVSGIARKGRIVEVSF